MQGKTLAALCGRQCLLHPSLKGNINVCVITALNPFVFLSHDSTSVLLLCIHIFFGKKIKNYVFSMIFDFSCLSLSLLQNGKIAFPVLVEGVKLR
jgi:hypothetical protein